MKRISFLLLTFCIQLSLFSQPNQRTNDTLPNMPGFPVFIGGGGIQDGAIHCNIDSDPEYELVFAKRPYVYALNHDGTTVPGWPVYLGMEVKGCPAFGDINGDGFGDVVMTNFEQLNYQNGYIFAFSGDGSPVAGFPIRHGYYYGTPVLEDLDGDNVMEIFLTRSDPDEMCVYKVNGEMFPGWPRPLLGIPSSSASVGDITGDDFKEIIVEDEMHIYAFNLNGDILPGFPYETVEYLLSYSAPILADLDNDGKREIIFGSHSIAYSNGKVFILKSDGSLFPGWPQLTSSFIFGTPSVGYVDNDNIPDIVAGDFITGSHYNGKVYAWNANGVMLSGFPITGINGVNAQITLADIDGDNMLELIFDDNSFLFYHGYNHDGTIIEGWPLNPGGGTFLKQPLITDLNRDGIMEIAASGVYGIEQINLWNTGVNYYSEKKSMPMYKYNVKHNGVFDDEILIGINPINGKIPEQYSLLQNYPNPFNPSTKIGIDIPSSGSGNVKLIIFDVLGKEMDVLINKDLKPGRYDIDWNASRFSSGVYFYMLITDKYTETKKMVLLK